MYLGFRILDVLISIWRLGFRGLGVRVPGLGFGIHRGFVAFSEGFGFRISGLGFPMHFSGSGV